MKTTSTLLLMTLLCIPTLTHGSTEPNPIAIGAKPIPFNANDHNGELWEYSKHIAPDKYLVLYFYPAAMTGGCTKQACAYRDDVNTLKELDITVIGVSADPVTNLKAFQQAENLNFKLLSDINGTIADIFGVPKRNGGSIKRKVKGQEKTLTRPYTTQRWTFIVDGQGKLIYKNTDVKAASDSQAVIAFIKGLK